MAQVNRAIGLYRALSELARRYQFRSRDEVCCYGLTVSQCYALQCLQSGPLTSTELSTKLGLDLSSTTRLVDELVKKKFVLRSRGANDARVRKIEMTAAARKLMTRIEEDFSAILENAVAGLPDSLIEALPDVILRLNQALSCATEQSVILPGQIRKKAG